MAVKIKTWVWIIVGIVGVCILGAIAMAGVGFYFFAKHFDTHSATPASAARDFDEIKARLAGQTPLIELDDHGRYLRSNTDRKPVANARPPESLYVLAFDPDDQRVVKVTIPFWLLRLKTRGTVDFNGRRMDLEDLKLTVEDLERFGPTLIVDHRASSGERVLVWSQ
jgi:flagellar basal body-associated protein FliL